LWLPFFRWPQSRRLCIAFRRAERCAARHRTRRQPLVLDPKITYPESKKVEQVDDYFGTKVADPYRWLEDETPRDKAWVEDQNK
jgi:hypothetical protein